MAGIPKTIDNDLVATHTAPGYGSAARTLALAVRSVGLDMRAMRHKEEIAVVETMGRHVGWLTAATALARALPDDPPHLILLPEAPVTEEALLAAVTAAHRRHGYCVIATTEGALTTGPASTMRSNTASCRSMHRDNPALAGRPASPALWPGSFSSAWGCTRGASVSTWRSVRRASIPRPRIRRWPVCWRSPRRMRRWEERAGSWRR